MIFLTKGDNGGVWTDELVAKLRTLWLQGYSANEIAKDLGEGLTRSAVSGKARRIGLSDAMKPADRPGASFTPLAGKGWEGVPRPRREPVERRSRAKVYKSVPPPPTAPVKPSPPVLLTGAEKPWTDRGRFECSWIVAGEGADSIACCQAVHKGSWCAAHYRLGTTPGTAMKPKDRKYIERRAA